MSRSKDGEQPPIRLDQTGTPAETADIIANKLLAKEFAKLGFATGDHIMVKGLAPIFIIDSFGVLTTEQGPSAACYRLEDRATEKTFNFVLIEGFRTGAVKKISS